MRGISRPSRLHRSACEARSYIIFDRLIYIFRRVGHVIDGCPETCLISWSGSRPYFTRKIRSPRPGPALRSQVNRRTPAVERYLENSLQFKGGPASSRNGFRRASRIPEMNSPVCSSVLQTSLKLLEARRTKTRVDRREGHTARWLEGTIQRADRAGRGHRLEPGSLFWAFAGNSNVFTGAANSRHA